MCSVQTNARHIWVCYTYACTRVHCNKVHLHTIGNWRSALSDFKAIKNTVELKWKKMCAACLCARCSYIRMIVYLVCLGRITVRTLSVCKWMASQPICQCNIYTAIVCVWFHYVRMLAYCIIHKWVHRFFNTSLTSLCAYLTASTIQPKQHFLFSASKINYKMSIHQIHVVHTRNIDA